jgi:hypothetical protein
MLLYGWNYKITGEEPSDKHKHKFPLEFVSPKFKIGQRVLSLAPCKREHMGELVDGFVSKHCYVVGSYFKEEKHIYQTMETPTSEILEFPEHKLFLRE